MSPTALIKTDDCFSHLDCKVHHLPSAGRWKSWIDIEPVPCARCVAPRSVFPHFASQLGTPSPTCAQPLVGSAQKNSAAAETAAAAKDGGLLPRVALAKVKNTYMMFVS